MADRKLQYIIEMIADDSQIRKQMKGWDWADIMGTAGKSFGDMMGDEAKYGADEIKRAFKGLNVDWTQILGTKEIGQLEQALARSLQKNKTAIQDMANKKDAQGIQNTIDLMVELGKEFQAIGSNFDAGQIARSLGAFTKALQTDKIAKFVTDTEKLVNTLDQVFNGKVDVGKSLNISGTMQASMRALKATEDEISKASNDLKEYTSLISKLKSAGAIDIKLGTNIKELDAQMKEWQDKADALVDARGKKQKADYNIAIKNIMAIEEARLKLGARPTEDYIGNPIQDVDFPEYEKKLQRFIKKLEQDIEALREKVNNVLGTSFAEEISKQISNIKIDLVLDEKSKASFKKELNAFIEKLNTDKITSAKVNIDWSLNSKEANGANAQVASVENIKNAIKGKVEELNTTVTELEQSKKHFDEIAKQHIDNKEPQKATYAQGESNKLKARIAELKETIRAEQELLDLSDDPTTRQELTSMLRSFEAIQKVASAKQGEILSKTRDWRQKMTEAMSVDKKDINIQLGFEKGLEPSLNNLYNAIQNYFTENEIELHINKEAFIQEVKDAMANGGISGGTLGGGGTVNFDMASLKSAIAEGLLAALTGDFTPIGTGDSIAQPGATSGGKKQNYVYLDPDTPYMKEMVNAVRQFAEYAQKDTAPAKKIRSFFDMKGVDLKSMVNASPMDIADMLSTLVGKYGATLIDDLNNMPADVSKNNMVTAFRSELAELIHSQAIKQTTVDDELRRLQSIDVFNDLVEKAKILEAFNTKNPKWQISDPAVFDKMFIMARGSMDKTSDEYLNASKAFEAVKSAIANKEGLDSEAQKERLQEAITSFKETVGETYDALSRYVQAFEMDVFVRGTKKPYRVKGRGVLKAQDTIGDDSSKLQDVHIYKDISTAALGTTRRRQELKMIGGYGAKTGILMQYPDRTDILNKDVTIEDFVEPEDVVKRWQDDDTATKRAENRATQATKLLAQSEARATELASAETEIQKQIEEKTQQKTSLQNEIAKNQKAIAKANDNPRKLAGARTRLARRQAALDAAKAERDAAKENKQIIDSIDHSARDREVADINATRVRYESWQKNIDKWMSDPEKYDDEYSRVTEELYGKDLRTAKKYRENAQENIDSTKWQINAKDKDIGDIQSDIKKFGDTPEKQRKLELAIKQREQYVKQLQQYEEEYTKQDAEIKRIRAKIYGYTEADTEAFRADFQGYMSKEFQKLDERETRLGVDSRAQAEARLAEADKAYQKAQREYDKVASSDEAKKAMEVDQLKAKNQELTSQVENLDTELEEAKNKQKEIVDKRAVETTREQLTLGPQKEEVESLINQTEKLNKDIYQAKKDADELDKKVQEAMNAKDYKRQEYDIKRTKKDQALIDRRSKALQRSTYLNSVKDGTVKETDIVPDNLTKAMSTTIESLNRSRETLRVLSQEFNLDKFASEGELKTDIQARLAKSLDGTNVLHPIIQEFYNKIINDGKKAALEWRKNILSMTAQDESAQIAKLTSFAEKDNTSVAKLKPEIEGADARLKETFHIRVEKWAQSIKTKIAALDKGGLNPQEEALTIKEIEGLFDLINRAKEEYVSIFSDVDYLMQYSNLQQKYDGAKDQDKAEYRKQLNALKEANNQKLFDELLGANKDLMTKSSGYIYGKHLSQTGDQYTTQRDMARSELEAKMAEREPLLQTRQAELLRDIEAATKAGDTEAVKKLEAALTEVNEELARYYQYHQLLKSSKIVDVLADDTEFVSRLSKHLYDGALLGYNADLDKAKGMSDADLNSKYYTVLDQQQQQIDDEVYDKLQTKQTALLKEIETLSKDGKDAQHLVIALKAVNQELVEYELNKRRAEDIKLGGKAYKADTEVMRVYNEETRALIEAEQELAIARATGTDVEDKLSAKNKQKNKWKKNIQTAQTSRANREESGGARAKALEYLTKTEEKYTTALEQRAALNRRMRIKESQIENIENDSKYSTSWQYKQHQRVVKGRLVDEYVGSDDYHKDRDRGIAKVKSEMMSYLEGILPPEAAEKVLSQFITPEGELGDKINLDAMQKTFGDILRDNAEYQRYLTDREAEYNRILGAERGTVKTDNTDFNLMVDEMHKYRDALAIGAEEIEAVKQANIEMLQTVSEDDYEPLKKEMQKVKSRVNLDAMVAGFKDVISDPKKNKSREATINNLKSQVLQAGGNQTEANQLAEELNQIGDSALKDVNAWAKRFLPQIFHTTEDQFREEARRNLIANEETYAKTELAALQRDYDMSEKRVRAMFAGETSRGADSFVNKYLGDWISQLGTDGAFKGLAEGTVTDIVTQFKTLMEENVFNIVSKYGESLVVENGMLGGINIREEVKKQLLAELHGTTQKSEFTGEEIFIPGYEQKAQEINANIAHIEAQRKAAMKYGGISSGDVVDAEVLREQTELAAKLTSEKEKQQALTAEIARLEGVEGSTEELGHLNAALDETNQNIRHLEAQVSNRDNLLGILQKARTEEEAEKRLTPEEKRAWFANKLEVAKVNLESGDEKVRKQAEEQIARYTARLNDINTQMAAEEAERRKDSSVIGMMTKALRDAFGGKGGFALDASGVATEATLSQILQILTGVIGALGGEIIRDPEMEKKLARMRELEAKRGVVAESSTKSNNAQTLGKKTKKDNPDYIVNAREFDKKELSKIKTQDELSTIAKQLVADIEKAKQGTKEALELQLKLQKVVNKSGELYKASSGKKTYKAEEVGKLLGIDDKVGLRVGENKAREIADKGFIESEKQVENEKKKTAETQKQVENEKKETAIASVLDSNKKEIVAGTNITDLKSGQKDAYAKYIGQSVGNYKPSDAIFSDEKALKAKVKELQGIMTTSATDSEEYLKAMVEMSRLISTWRNVVKQTKPEMKDNAKWQEYLTKGKGKLFDKKENVPLGGITSTSKVTLKQTAMNLGTKISEDAKNELFVAQEVAKTTKEEVQPAQQKAEAKEREAAAETAITEEKKEQKAVGETKGGWTNAEKAEYDRLAKDTAGYSAKVVFGEGGNLGGLALDSTLQEILTAIRNIQANGIKKGGGSGSGSGRSKPKGKTEADLIGERALKQQDIVRGLAAGRGKATDSGSALFAKYEAEVAALNTAIDNANKAKKNKQAVDINAVKTAAAKVEALTNNILRDTADWDFRTSQSDDVWDYKLPKNQKMTQARMEAEAQKTFNKNKEQYKFLSFDGDTLTYQLTDLEGKVRNVTMVWSDFNQQIALTSDKTTNKLDPLAEKVQKLKEKFEDAKAAGYLNADDAGLTKFAAKLAEIGNAKTFEDVERLRKEALGLGDVVNKTISTNKRWMVGKGAKTQADNQYNKIFGTIQAGDIDMSDESTLLKTYLTAYNELNTVYDKYAKNNELNNPKIQQALQQQANAVQILGKKYLTSVQQAGELQGKVDKSGTFKDAKTGEELNLGGTLDLSGQEVGSLKDKMQDFVKNGLRQANIEGVKFDAINQRMTYGIRLNADTVADMAVEYNDATKALYAYQVRERDSLTGFKGFVRDMKAKGKSILSYLTYTTSIYRLISVVRQGITYVKEIDAAMTELRKVTDETNETYNRFLDTASKVASKVGSTTKEIVSSTADWARIGYSLQDATTLAESTAVLLNVSEFQSIDEATSALTSTLQAFGYAAKDSMHVVDVMNEIGNNYAISSNGVATALQDSASSLMAANNSYQEAVALIAAANRVVQDPNSVGAALRTISLRLRGTSTKELEEAGEDTTGVVTSKSKLRTKIQGYTGIDILTDSGAYKSTYEILLEISKVWDNLNDMDRAGLLELLAGKTRSNTLAAILGNTKDLEDAYKSAMEAEGSAWKENEKYLDSIQGKMDLFNNSVQTMWANALDDKAIKGFVDFGRILIELVDNVGLLKSLFIALGTYVGAKHFNGNLFGGLFGGVFADKEAYTIPQVQKRLKDLQKAMDEAKAELDKSPGDKSRQRKYNKTEKAYNKYNEQVSPQIEKYDALIARQTQAQKNFDQANFELSRAIRTGANQADIEAYGNNVNNARLELEKINAEVENFKIQTSQSIPLTKRMWNDIKTGAVTAAKAIGKVGQALLQSYVMMQAMSLLFTVLDKIFSSIGKKWPKSAEKTWEEFEELNAELKNSESKLKSLEGELDTINDRIDELMDKGKLSFTDQEELDALRAQSEELKTQISLAKTLRDNLQITVNQASINAIGKYLNETSFASETSQSERVDETSAVGQSAGTTVGYALGKTVIASGITALVSKGGAALGTKAGAMLGSLAGPIGTVIGTVAGTVIGGIAGKAIGGATAGKKYESEQTVQEALDAMEKERAALKQAQIDAYKAYANKPTDDKLGEKFDNASDELAVYDQNMAKHISKIQEAYNAIDISQLDLSDDADKAILAYKRRIGDILDEYNINMGGKDAKFNAISRIFGEEADQELKDIDKQIKESIKSGEEVDFAETFNNDNLKATKQRLDELGISITDLKYYYLDWKKAEEEVEGNTYETVKSVASLTDSVGALKDAFGEFQEEGLISADTLVDLYDKFGTLGDAWDNYVDVMATGTSSTQEAREATEELLEALMNQRLDKGPIKDMKEYLTLIGQLQNLGVSNAKGYADALQKTSMISSISRDVVNQEKELAELEEKKKNGQITENEYNEKKANLQKTTADFIKQYEDEYKIDLSDEEERVLFKKAITAEKAKQDAASAQARANEYGEASRKQEDADTKLKQAEADLEKAKTDAQKIKQYNDILDNASDYGGRTELNSRGVHLVEFEDISQLPEELQKIMTKNSATGTYYLSNNMISDLVSPEMTVEEAEKAVKEAEKVVDEAKAKLDVTPSVDVEAAEQEAKEAEEAYQKALDDLGLTIQIELYESSQAVDDIQSVFDTLSDAVKEYNEKGYLSVDTAQALTDPDSIDPKYLTLLQDENSQLSLTKDKLYEVAVARLTDLKVKRQDAILTDAENLAKTASIDALRESSEVLYGEADALQVVNKERLKTIRGILEERQAKGELIGFNIDSYMTNLESQLDTTGKIFDSAIDNIKESISSSGNGATESALEQLQKKYERQIKNLEAQQTQIENQIEILEAKEEGVSADYYEKEIEIEQKKKALYEQQHTELLKLKRTDEVADALWEVEHAIQESTLRMIEFRKSIAELYATASDRISEAYDDKGQVYDDRKSYIENEISIRETKGELTPTSVYDDLIEQEELARANAETELNAQADLYWQGIKENGEAFKGSEQAVDLLEKIRQKKLDIQESDKAIADYAEQQKDAYIAYFDKMMEAYSHRNDLIQAQADSGQSYIDRLEVLNINVPDEAYEEMAAIQEIANQGLQEQFDFASAELDNMEAEGIDKNDSRYIEKFKEVLDLEQQIYEGETKVLEYHQQIIDNHLDRFNQVVDRINHATSQLENVSGLVDSEDVAEEDGSWTAEGLTQLGMTYQQMEYNKQVAAGYADEMEYLDEQFKAGKISEKEYTEQMQELQNGQWDAINAYKSAEDAIVDLNEARIDMVEEGLNKEIEAYQELIDLKKEELDSERDLYNFRKDIQKQTKDIAALERRIASMSGSTDAATIAERTRLEKDLREAREGLDDTYYNHAMDSQSNALDDELEAYTKSSEDYIESLRESIKDTKLVVEQTFTEVLGNADIVLSTINRLSGEYGFTIDGYLTNPWENASNAATLFKQDADISGLINEDGIITAFGKRNDLATVFNTGSMAAFNFKNDVGWHMTATKNAVEKYTSGNMPDYLGSKLKAPWDDAGNDTNSGPLAFSTKAKGLMDGIVDYAETNFKNQLKEKLDYGFNSATGYDSWGNGVTSMLNGKISEAEAAGKKIAEHLNVQTSGYVGNPSTDGNGNPTGSGTSPYSGKYNANVKALQEVLNTVFGTGLVVDGRWGTSTANALKKAQKQVGVTADGKYGQNTRDAISQFIARRIDSWKKSSSSSMVGQGIQMYQQMQYKLPYAFHAKGTLGTTRDQLAITDESWIGEEITLAAGKNGQLQYLKKGSAVMPADISANLVEWGKLNPNMMDITSMTDGINLMSNYINKPEIKVDVENFLNVGTVSRDTLPELEKLMDKKIDTFAKQLNASIRKFK